MKIIEEFIIEQKADIIYAKRTLQSHFCEEKFRDKSFFLLAFMELATNLVKYTEGGKVLLLESGGHYMLGVVDYGGGIESVARSLQRGYTTAENSLGLGLYQLSSNNLYDFEIFSTQKKNFHGTVILLKPKELQERIICFSKPYTNKESNGDFYAKKGKFLLFGDAAGHNKKSYKTAKLIEKRFYSSKLSCIMIDDFFKQIHQELHEKEMHSAVFVIVEAVKNHISLCGVDLSVWIKTQNHLALKTLKNGIIGEAFSSVEKLHYDLKEGDFCIITTDGMQNQKMEYFKNEEMSGYSAYFMALVMWHFATSQFDDSSVVVIKN